ncbi:MAG: peptidoglycan editing factor PgeF [Hyphomicrobiaceae bacterium]
MPSPILADNLAALTGIRHGFFTREGGVSGGIYASLNVGLGSRDDRSRVIENRARVARHLGVASGRLSTAYQVHSAEALVIDRPIEDDLPRVDALVTRTPGVVLGALTADCCPVLLADQVAGVVAAAHAGWRGALSGIVAATVAAMEGIGAERSRIVAAIGPTITQASYEVGPELEARFLESDAANARFFTRPSVDARPRFDLPGFVASRVAAESIGGIGMACSCTYVNEATFFSYRRTTHRGESDYGRQISAIVVA